MDKTICNYRNRVPRVRLACLEDNVNLKISFSYVVDSDNLYEPVNPPQSYGTGSTYMAKDPHETGSLDGRRFDIPPDIDVIIAKCQ
jgi:hypothetical protein